LLLLLLLFFFVDSLIPFLFFNPHCSVSHLYTSASAAAAASSS